MFSLYIELKTQALFIHDVVDSNALRRVLVFLDVNQVVWRRVTLCMLAAYVIPKEPSNASKHTGKFSTLFTVHSKSYGFWVTEWMFKFHAHYIITQPDWHLKCLGLLWQHVFWVFVWVSGYRMNFSSVLLTTQFQQPADKSDKSDVNGYICKICVLVRFNKKRRFEIPWYFIFMTFLTACSLLS